jgi:hypothetical protein
MTIREHLTHIFRVTVTPLLLACVCATPAVAQSPTVPLTINVNLALSKLHPAVMSVKVACVANFSYGGTSSGTSNHVPIVNRGYTGLVSIKINLATAVVFAKPENRSVPVICRLQFNSANGIEYPAASAAEPQNIMPTNSNVVGTGAVLVQSKVVTFPNIAP